MAKKSRAGRAALAANAAATRVIRKRISFKLPSFLVINLRVVILFYGYGSLRSRVKYILMSVL